MEPIDIIIIAVIALIIGAAAAYVIKAKKSGRKCIGCPDSCSCHSKSKKQEVANGGCSGNCSCCSGCHSDISEDENGVK